MAQVVAVAPAEGVPFFTPAQEPLTGTASGEIVPTIFKPMKIRSTAFQNRIWVAPMCMFSSKDGLFTPFHEVHYGGFTFRGASLTLIEATAVSPNGRISPHCTGLWSDAHIEGLKKIVEFSHSQGQKIGIQLAHAGRKGSTVPPWLWTGRGQSAIASKEAGGFADDLVGPSALSWGPGHGDPRELTVEEIKGIVSDFRDAAKRAVTAGVDVIEIHAAHGYLLCSFLSPLSNQRTDDYGGSFENRTRLLVEVIRATREVIPESMPLLLRVSSTEWMEQFPEPSWTVEDTIELAKLLPGLGVDLLDVSSGGNSHKQVIPVFNDKQPGISGRIRRALREAGITNLLVGAVGMITEAEKAKEIVQDTDLIEVETERGEIAKADVVMVGRQFLREPEWVLKTAKSLGVDVTWPVQYSYAAVGRKSTTKL